MTTFFWTEDTIRSQSGGGAAVKELCLLDTGSTSRYLR